MATNESTAYRAASAVGRFLIGLVTLAVLIGIGFSFWPKIKAAYYAAPPSIEVQQTSPEKAAVDTSEIDRLKAQNAAIQAQLNTARSRTIVQEVPAGQSPQTTTINTPPAPDTSDTTTNGAPAEPPPASAPIVIIHQVSADGSHQTVTGSGACAVAHGVARRCGK